MADGTVVLPPELRAAIQAPEAGLSGRRNGVGIPIRPDDTPRFESDEISIDVPGLSLGIGEDGSLSFGDDEEDDAGLDFGENLAEVISDMALGAIAEEVISGVEADEQSRQEWINQYQKGIGLLGNKIEDLKQGSDDKRSVSRAGDTTMMEAIVKYEAGAEAEMLPAAGPVKVPTIGKVSGDEEQIAKDFEDDFNYYLTEVATEYYADTPRMLVQQGFCGIGYKKVYLCPVRRRPVSESILPTDLIVSEEATDLNNALRVTHRIEMTLPTLRRMQIVGQYRDVQLGPAIGNFGVSDQARRAIRTNEGLMPIGATRPQDQPYEVLETDVFLDAEYHGIDGYYERRAPEGLPLPYKVTVERGSRKVLGIWRNWKEGDPLYLKRNAYVKFGLVPGLGYHDWGFLQLLGNQTLALRAILRLLIAAGMFSNFPGGLKLKNARTATNELAPAPGEFVDVDAPQGADIRQMAMPLPYKGPDAAFIQLMGIVKNDARQLGGTVQLEVGEGRTNMPVGTVLAMIEQQIQVMAGVHKRNHRAQKEEFRKLRELFAENPRMFSMLVRDRPRDADRQARLWEKAEEFSDLNIVPASDPNVPSHVHKLLMGNVLLLLAQQAPQYFDMPAVLSNAVTAIGANPSEYILRPDQMQQGAPPPDPKIVAATIHAQQQQSQDQVQAQTEAAKLQLAREKLAVEAARAAADNQTQMAVAHTKAATDAATPYHEAVANPPAQAIPTG